MSTGLFYHRSFEGRRWPIVGDRYKDFGEKLGQAAKDHSAKLFHPQPAEESLLERVHSREFLDTQRKQWYYDGARLTVGGAVEGSEKVYNGEIDNAIVFLVAAGHHAAPTRAWGGTYLSCIGPIVQRLRDLGVERIAYLDTDSHHGDGARAVIQYDRDVLHVCFCGHDHMDDKNNICVDVTSNTTDDAYLDRVLGTFETIRSFNPEIIIHFFGHDTHRDDYGNRGLTREFFPRLAEQVLCLADRTSGGRYVVIDGGGANHLVGQEIMLELIGVLSRS